MIKELVHVAAYVSTELLRQPVQSVLTDLGLLIAATVINLQNHQSLFANVT